MTCDEEERVKWKMAQYHAAAVGCDCDAVEDAVYEGGLNTNPTEDALGGGLNVGAEAHVVVEDLLGVAYQTLNLNVLINVLLLESTSVGCIIVWIIVLVVLVMLVVQISLSTVGVSMGSTAKRMRVT